MSFEESHLLAYQFGQPRQAPTIPDVPGPMPMGKLGSVKVSRLIAGHNLVGGTAHARDLIYVSQLLQRYFTDDKILETYRLYEERGINTAFLRIEGRQLALARATPGGTWRQAPISRPARDQREGSDARSRHGVRSRRTGGVYPWT